jgi:hypothetical protein
MSANEDLIKAENILLKLMAQYQSGQYAHLGDAIDCIRRSRVELETLSRDYAMCQSVLVTEREEWNNAAKFVADGCEDETHCGCVPILKRELDKATLKYETLIQYVGEGDELAITQGGAVKELDSDMHNPSKRPCKTCQAMTDAFGFPFGCNRLRGE